MIKNNIPLSRLSVIVTMVKKATGKIKGKKFCRNNLAPIFAVRIKKREFSSVGLEHLPYKQRVGGSTPSTPTKCKRFHENGTFFYFGH